MAKPKGLRAKTGATKLTKTEQEETNLKDKEAAEEEDESQEQETQEVSEDTGTEDQEQEDQDNEDQDQDNEGEEREDEDANDGTPGDDEKAADLKEAESQLAYAEKEKEAGLEPSTITVQVPVEMKSAEKKVRIKPNKDLSTYIGTEWYNLKAGKEVTVPENVKTILRRAGHLEAL